MEYKLTTPLTKEALAPLLAGDTVRLSGVVYTARDAAHKRMMELLDEGKPLPFPVEIEGRNQGIQALILACKDFGCSFENTLARIKNSFSLSDDEALEDMKLYW